MEGGIPDPPAAGFDCESPSGPWPEGLVPIGPPAELGCPVGPAPDPEPPDGLDAPEPFDCPNPLAAGELPFPNPLMFPANEF